VKSAVDFSEISAGFGQKLTKISCKSRQDFTEISTLNAEKGERKGEKWERYRCESAYYINRDFRPFFATTRLEVCKVGL